MWKLKILLTILLCFHTLAATSSLCPSECSCQKKSTDCTDKNLASVPTGISSATKRLCLDNNTLTRIPHNAFVNLSNLVELQLSTNKLNSLDGFLSSNLVLLQLFNVCSNALTNVSQNALDQSTGLIVSLSFLIFNGTAVTSECWFVYILNFQMIKSLQVLNPTMTPHRFPVTELAFISSSLSCFLFQDLDLSHNKISKIHRHAFNKLL
ncbi:unnamed protein product [Clavelina lepadiformis]|uniref:LRRNT domain-containing protein n=1 Tax=Clavelina lepadiformis TaxID=159417 RepID=A0ABP0G2E8_CLALP